MTPEWVPGWKVVMVRPSASVMTRGHYLLTHHEYVSCAAPSVSTVFYAHGQITHRPPECGPLAIFDLETNAKHFALVCLSENAAYKILEVGYIPYRIALPSHSANTTSGLWGPTTWLSLAALPLGTQLAEEVYVL